MAMKITTTRRTTDQTISQASSPDPTKIWRPVRPITTSDPTEDQISQLRGQFAKLTSSLSSLGITVTDNQATSPVASGNLPAQVTGVSASVTAKNINGVLMAVLDVNFTPHANFASAQLWLTNYNGNTAPQLVTSGFSSPIEYAAQVTGELVTITVVAVNSAGVAASFSSAPTTTALLNGSSTAPPAPTISQALVALSGGTGWQFSFNIINGLLADVISGYWIYRSTTHTTPTSPTGRFQWIAQPPSTLPYTFQDITGSTYYYWVSAVSVSGLESALTDASAVSTTGTLYPSASSGSFSNPTYAYDGNEVTYAAGNVTSPSGPGSASTSHIWSAFPALPTGVTIDAVQLQVSSYAAISNVGSATLSYSLDNGATWTNLYSLTGTDGNSVNVGKAYFNATLLTTQDTTQVKVRATAIATSFHPSGADPSEYDQGTIAQNLYEIRIAVTSH